MLVKVRSCGLCSTDLWKAVYHIAGDGDILGHEVSGEVAEIGQGIEGFELGDRVAVYHHAECGTCYYCKHDQGTLYSQSRQPSIFPGAFSECVLVRPHIA